MTRDRLPNLIIPGVTKAGTTSVFWYLSQHPEICAADTKQINYYAPLRYGREPETPLSAYAAHFAHCGGERYRLDASPTYFYGGTPMVQRIARDLPDARILALLRNPTRRLWSSYTYKLSKARLAPGTTFAEFVARGKALADATDVDWERHENHRTLSVGRYIDYLPDWYEVFGDRVEVLFFEDVKEDPATALSRVHRWLDIDVDRAADLDYGVRNRTIQPRSHALRQFAEVANRRLRPLLERAPAVKDHLRGVYYRRNASNQTPVLTEQDRAEVDAIYAEPNRQLAELIVQHSTQPLPSWLATHITS